MAHAKTAPVKGKGDLVGGLEAGATARADWRIGTEHEKFLFERQGLARPAYEGNRGVRALLQGLADEHGWTPIMEGEHIIGLKDNEGGSITLEPGGQFELSGAPLENLHQTCDETNRHLTHLRAATARLGLGMLGVGFDPKWSGRYSMDAERPLPDHAEPYAEGRQLGLDMMHGPQPFRLISIMLMKGIWRASSAPRWPCSRWRQRFSPITLP